MEERRRFDRIDDRVSMTYEIIEQDRLSDVLARLEETAGGRQKLLAETVEPGSKKNTRLSTVDDDLVPTKKISLSAGGASFHAPQSVRIHDYLELTLTLYPDLYIVKAAGKVVACRDVLPSAPEFNKLVAVDFIYLHDRDRQYIISHVLKKRSVQTI